MSFPLRLFGAALLSALLVAVAGKGWEVRRFGLNDAAAVRHLEDAVRRGVAERSERVESLARRVAVEEQLVLDATVSRDALPRLFERLATLAEPASADAVTVTIYVPDRPAVYRVLAWSDGPAGDVAPNLLDGPTSLFVAPGTAGLRLMFVQPIQRSGRRIAVVAAETVLSASTDAGTPTLGTLLGPVSVIPTYAAGALEPTNGFVIERPRLEVHFDPDDLARRRVEFQRRTLAVAALPLVVALVVLAARLLDRPRERQSIGPWLVTSGFAIVILSLAAIGLAGLLHVLAAPPAIGAAVLVATLVVAVAIAPADAWWRPWRREIPAASPVRFAVEQLAAGAAIGAAILGSWRVLSQRITASSLASWQSALFPFDPLGLLDVWTSLFAEIAMWWAAASILALVAARWRLTMTKRISVLAIALWLLPIAAVWSIWDAWSMAPIGPSITIAATLVAFALTATALRRHYRHTTQASRLWLGFLALLVPLVSTYPMVASTVERATRAVIERDYAPQAARQSDEIRQVLLRTQLEIDRLPTLPDQVRATPTQPVDSQTAFLVWTQTSLKSTRVVSDIELYGPDRSLVSRFALNFPEYVYRSATQKWQGTGCSWDVSGEVTRFGSTDRAMLHAERGLCDASGQTVGAVVLHVAPADYQALPFVASASPYADVLRTTPGATREAGPNDLELVVYGWSLQPVFTASRNVAWTIDDPTFAQIYRDGRPFWTSLAADRRLYHVYFLQNRAGIYALGYPNATWLDHASRLAEIAAVAAALFVLLQITAAFYAPIARRPEAPLRVLLHEIRTSFYRKLFLFFVLVAVGPVLAFALAFGAYMTSKFRADVQGEAASVVAVARRVFEQVATAEQPLNQPPTDDVMVWIRQVIDQDVNLFDGSELVATSQRDLFNSGLLPTRTPASVYRRIVLERLPTFVTEDQQYLVAASPVPARGRDAVLSVPLAPRQREIEQENDELNRSVLVGSMFVVLFAAGLGASLASRVSDPVARLTKATRQIAAGKLDVRIAADTADELKRLVDDFNTMTARLLAQRAELARTNQLKAWNEMARQVAHEIKNPLTPIQLAAEHLERVHGDRGRPLGEVFDQCIRTILGQVRLLRQIASEFANFAGEPTARPELLNLAELVEAVVGPYRLGLSGKVHVHVEAPAALPPVRADRTLLLRALTNLVENAIQAMPLGGALRVSVTIEGERLLLRIADTGVGMDGEALARAFEPYFSTKTGGSGLGLANAKRNIEREGGTVALASAPAQGTVVTITLPVAAAHRDGPAGATAPSR